MNLFNTINSKNNLSPTYSTGFNQIRYYSSSSTSSSTTDNKIYLNSEPSTIINDPETQLNETELELNKFKAVQEFKKNIRVVT